MIQLLRTWRQASPAVVNCEPGYWTNGWMSTPISAPGNALVPGWVPLSRTARQTGALLPGCDLARAALDSSGAGNCGATKPAGAPFPAVADPGAAAC